MTGMGVALRRHRDRLAFWALGGFALFVTHDTIHLAQVGPGRSLVEALRTAGHGYWGWASLALTIFAMIAGLSAWLRLRHLQARASTLRAAPGSARPLARRFASAWWRLALIVGIGFVVQENAEHLITPGHVLGATPLLGPEQPLAMPVIGLISWIAAVLAAFVTGAQEALVVAIEAALRRAIRAARVLRRAPGELVGVIGPVLAHPGAGRAPPSLVVSAT